MTARPAHDPDRWVAALDEFEEALDRLVGLSVAAHDPADGPPPPLRPFHPPGNLGPLPGSLRLRATELAARAGLIHTELTRLRDRTAEELAALSRPAAAYHREPVAPAFDARG